MTRPVQENSEPPHDPAGPQELELSRLKHYCIIAVSIFSIRLAIWRHQLREFRELAVSGCFEWHFSLPQGKA
jgi:hypothetical protein